MKLSTVIVGLLLAFLLFTSQGQKIGSAVAELAFDAGTKPTTPAPDPAKLAAEAAKREACLKVWRDWDVKVKSDEKDLAGC
jgi:hypothetical protein